MTRKDYIALAATIKANLNAEATTDGRLATIELAEAIADEVLRPDNPRFDRDRFLTACGVTDNAQA